MNICRVLVLIGVVAFIILFIYQSMQEAKWEHNHEKQLKESRPVLNYNDMSIEQRQNEAILNYLEEIVRVLKQVKSETASVRYASHANAGIIASSRR